MSTAPAGTIPAGTTPAANPANQEAPAAKKGYMDSVKNAFSKIDPRNWGWSAIAKTAAKVTLWVSGALTVASASLYFGYASLKVAGLGVISSTMSLYALAGSGIVFSVVGLLYGASKYASSKDETTAPAPEANVATPANTTEEKKV